MPDDAPRRLNYYYGRLLGVGDYEAEQSYFLAKHWRHNRDLHGPGVVWGLDVAPSGSGVTIGPGLAIDHLGREILLPEARKMPDPRQPIDESGEPCGEPVEA